MLSILAIFGTVKSFISGNKITSTLSILVVVGLVGYFIYITTQLNSTREELYKLQLKAVSLTSENTALKYSVKTNEVKITAAKELVNKCYENRQLNNDYTDAIDKIIATQDTPNVPPEVQPNSTVVSPYSSQVPTTIKEVQNAKEKSSMVFVNDLFNK